MKAKKISALLIGVALCAVIFVANVSPVYALKHGYESNAPVIATDDYPDTNTYIYESDEQSAAMWEAFHSGAAANDGSVASAPATTTTPSATAAPAAPALNIVDIEGQYVAIEESKVYADAEQTEELGIVTPGQVLEVNGESSNGLYRFPFGDSNGFANKNAFATHADYQAAWEETENVEPTCTEDGKIVRTNSLSGLTEEETIPALGHDYAETDRTEPTCTEAGEIVYTCTRDADTYAEPIPALGHDEGEWVVATEPRAFSEGLRELRCTRDGATLESVVLPQTCPLPLWSVILICVGGIGIIVLVVVLVRRLRKEQSTAK